MVVCTVMALYSGFDYQYDNMTHDFKGKVAVVTGASRGIGRGIVLELARCGAGIIGIYAKNDEMAESAKVEIEKMGGNAVFIKCDVSNAAEVEDAADKAIQPFGKVDFVINNAGVHQHLRSWELSHEDWRKVIDINLTGTFNIAKAFIPSMREQKAGRIINISSCVAYTGTDHEVHYAASKSGVVGLTKSLALELALDGINVNAIAPGYIDTDMVVFDSEEQRGRTIETIPKRRLGQPADIAKAVAFLCSDDADYITGEIMHVNGGLLMA